MGAGIMKRDVGIQIDQVNARMAISLCAEAKRTCIEDWNQCPVAWF
jgi:hypothetical protein